MNNHYLRRTSVLMLFSIFLTQSITSKAQSTDDAFMMYKNQTCNGIMYTHSTFDHYWEGTLKRDNPNIGTVTLQSFAYMGVFGITHRLNILAAVPYIFTQASGGTLHGKVGIQDLSLNLKFKALEYSKENTRLGLYGIGGFSFPLSNYSADYLPLAIGSQSKVLSGRILGDFQFHRFFFTGSFFYNYRNNITIERNSYYTTKLHLTNQVEMPNQDGFTLRSGYRSTHLIAEAIFQNLNTLGGFDIRRNDNPFPSNRMNWSSIGMNLKYEFKKPLNGFTLYGGTSCVFQGRNAGEWKNYDAGLFYAFYVAKSNHSKTTSNL